MEKLTCPFCSAEVGGKSQYCKSCRKWVESPEREYISQVSPDEMNGVSDSTPTVNVASNQVRTPTSVVPIPVNNGGFTASIQSAVREAASQGSKALSAVPTSPADATAAPSVQTPTVTKRKTREELLAKYNAEEAKFNFWRNVGRDIVFVEIAQLTGKLPNLQEGLSAD